MTSDIVKQTLSEHKKLVEVIPKLIETLTKFPNDIQWGDSTWYQDHQYIRFVKIQTLSLENAMRNILQGCYRDSYNLIRMIFEGYFTLVLISTCDKYPVRIKVIRGKKDPNLEHARDRRIKEAEEIFGNNLIDIYTENNGKTLVAVVRGIPVVDDKKQETGVTIPYYYGAWREFRSVDYHLKKRRVATKYSTLNFLQGSWAGLRNAETEFLDKYEYLHRYYLNFDRMLENLRLNGILDNSTVTRVLVHYNFLSKFSHCTSESISILSERKIYQLSRNGLTYVYDHYLSELALLYVCHILLMHLQHSIHYFNWRAIKLRHDKGMYIPLCKKIESDFGYFWFIFNSPHQYDIYNHANRISNYREKIIYRPEDIKPEDVCYYDDPLYRLKQLHHSQQELTTGNVFVSPFLRNDSLF